MAPVDVRKGMPSVELSREEFEKRYRSRFADPAFETLQRELDAITAAAWDAYSNYRKSPLTRKAGPGFADPDYEISVDWLAAREAILAAQRRHDDASGMLEYALHAPETTARNDRGLDAIGGLNVRGGSGDDDGVFGGA